MGDITNLRNLVLRTYNDLTTARPRIKKHLFKNGSRQVKTLFRHSSNMDETTKNFFLIFIGLNFTFI